MIDLSMLQDFIAETGEHLEELETNLLKLETEPDNKKILNDIFRSAHTIKGSAEYLGMERISELSHKLENLLEKLRHGEMVINRQIIDILIEARDRIAGLVDDLIENQTENTQIDDLAGRIDRLSGNNDDSCEKLSVEGHKKGVPYGFEDHKDALSDSESEDGMGMLHADNGIQGLCLGLYKNDPEAGCETDSVPIEAKDDIEIYEEDQDEELFGIFIQQLKESFLFLKNRLAESVHSDRIGENLDSCLERINRLKSSSSYMDYTKLTEHYERWSNEIRQARDALSEGTEISLKFMERYLDNTLKFFPAMSELTENISTNQDDYLSAGSNSSGNKEIVPEQIEQYVDEVLPFEKEHDSDKYNVDSQDKTGLKKAEKEKIDGEQFSGATVLAASEIEADVDRDGEEKDIELFSIFVEQLKDSISFLNIRIDELKRSDNPLVILESCLKKINELRSSSNYMDYRNLTEHYEKWCDGITKVLEEISGGNKPSLDFMETYVKRIVELFPQAAEEAVKTGQVEDGIIQKTVISTRKELEPESETSIPESGERALEEALNKAFDTFTDIPPQVEIKPVQGEWENTLFSQPEPIIEGVGFIESEDDKAEKPQNQIIDNMSSEPDEVDVTQKRQDRQKSDRQKSDRLAEKMVKHSVRVDSKKIDSLMNQASELVISRAWFSQLFNEMKDFHHELTVNDALEQRGKKRFRDIIFRLSEATVSLGRISNELQEGVMKMRMLPIAQLFNRYPRLIHDLVRNNEKQVNLEIKGEETELDKMIIEEISDPLIHLIRNAVDHGIETVDERRKNGKHEVGKLQLEAYHESNHVVIEISDDGRGIDAEKIKAAALEKGLLKRSELDRMGTRELIDIIMMPGFSTVGRITKTSGRGVGMDVVKQNIEKLNGTIEIETKAGEGTRIRLKIPLTLAIIRALMVRVGSEIFTIPLAAVEETLRIFDNDISFIEGIEVIHLRDKTLPLIRLSGVFNIDADSDKSGKEYVVVVSSGTKKVGLVVDLLLGQEEAVIKPLEDYLQEESGFSGATILGDGQISLILDVYELINLFLNSQAGNDEPGVHLYKQAEYRVRESSSLYENEVMH